MIYSCNIPFTESYTHNRIHVLISLHYVRAIVVIVGDLLGRDHNLTIWPTCIPRACMQNFFF